MCLKFNLLLRMNTELSYYKFLSYGPWQNILRTKKKSLNITKLS